MGAWDGPVAVRVGLCGSQGWGAKSGGDGLTVRLYRLGEHKIEYNHRVRAPSILHYFTSINCYDRHNYGRDYCFRCQGRAHGELWRHCTQLSSNSSERASAETESSDVQLQPKSTTSEPAMVSLLNCLRASQWYELTRMCTLRTNLLAAEGYTKKRPSCSADPKSVIPNSRVHEFPNNSLTVSARKLFCATCRVEISLKRSIITNHISSFKHKQSKVKLTTKESRVYIAQAL